MIWVFIAALIFTAGCRRADHTDGNQKRYVKLGIGVPVRSLDPRVGNEEPCSLIIPMLYEGLMQMGKEGKLFPGIAESYTVSEDRLTYTFYLRSAKWSNGDPLTAYDFEYAWKKSVDPRFVQGGAYNFYVIKNVEASIKGEVDVDKVGIRALDEKTLVVTLEHPAPYFLSLTTFSNYMPIHKKIDLKNKDWANQAGKNFVSNGPFILKEWKKGDFLTLVKNPNYWKKNEVVLPGITIYVLEDAMTGFYLFEKGEIDWFGDPFQAIPTEILRDKKVKKSLFSEEVFATTWMFLNTEVYPLNNKNLRKALSYAINRQEITEHVLQKGETPAMGILPSGLSVQDHPYFDDGNYKKAKYHFELALQELQIEKKEFPKIILNVDTRIERVKLCQVIQEQWRKILGIEVEIEKADWPVHFTKVSKGDYQIGKMNWISGLYDPIYFLDTFRLKSLSINMSRWEHPNYRDFLDRSDYEIDLEKRRNLLRQAEELLMEEMPVIPICFLRMCYIKNPNLKGVTLSPLDQIDFRAAYFVD